MQKLVRAYGFETVIFKFSLEEKTQYSMYFKMCTLRSREDNVSGSQYFGGAASSQACAHGMCVHMQHFSASLVSLIEGANKLHRNFSFRLNSFLPALDLLSSMSKEGTEKKSI